MKKIISIVLAVALALTSIFAFAACNKSKEAPVKVIDIKLTEEEYAFGVDKKQPELKASINDALAELVKNGTIDAIMNKYFNGEEITPYENKAKDSSKDQIVMATNAAFAPFEYKMGDKFAGIDIEIMKAIADKLGKELVIDDMDFEAVVTAVGSQKADVAAAALTVNETRKASVDFTTSYYNASQVLVVKADDTTFDACKTADDVVKILNEKGAVSIGFQKGTTGEYYVKGDKDWGFDGFAKANGVGHDTAGLAVTDMINGNLDYVVVDEMPAKTIVKNFTK